MIEAFDVPCPENVARQTDDPSRRLLRTSRAAKLPYGLGHQLLLSVAATVRPPIPLSVTRREEVDCLRNVHAE